MIHAYASGPPANVVKSSVTVDSAASMALMEMMHVSSHRAT
jgi:hypothetical protein